MGKYVPRQQPMYAGAWGLLTGIVGSLCCIGPSAAILLIAQDAHPRVVMEILRHTQISTTMNTYAHVLPRLQRDATAKVEELLREPASPDPASEKRQPEDQPHPAQDVSTILPKKIASDSSG